MKIAFIGTGSMGSAILAGVLAGGADPADIVATAHSTASAERLAAEYGVRALSVEADPDANAAAVAEADVVMLGVKPWMMADTVAGIRDALPESAVLVSMAAGVPMAAFEKWAPGQPIVRIMPNTPSGIGRGVVSLTAGEGVAAEVVAELEEMLGCLGLVVPMAEDQIPAMIGISGSGVAYFFQLAEHLVRAGEELGLDHETARRIVVATADGAGRLLEKRPDPEAARKAVTSKGGTTAAALRTFAEGGFEELTLRAARAAADRNAEMERENA